MEGTRRIGVILLSIWLIATSLVSLTDLSFPGMGTILALLAIAAGIMVLLQSRRTRVTRRLGTLVLGVWLVASGLLSVLSVSFPGQSVVLGVLAAAAGVLLLMRR